MSNDLLTIKVNGQKNTFIRSNIAHVVWTSDFSFCTIFFVGGEKTQLFDGVKSLHDQMYGIPSKGDWD